MLAMVLERITPTIVAAAGGAPGAAVPGTGEAGTGLQVPPTCTWSGDLNPRVPHAVRSGALSGSAVLVPDAMKRYAA